MTRNIKRAYWRLIYIVFALCLIWGIGGTFVVAIVSCICITLSIFAVIIDWVMGE